VLAQARRGARRAGGTSRRRRRRTQALPQLPSRAHALGGEAQLRAGAGRRRRLARRDHRAAAGVHPRAALLRLSPRPSPPRTPPSRAYGPTPPAAPRRPPPVLPSPNRKAALPPTTAAGRRRPRPPPPPRGRRGKGCPPPSGGAGKPLAPPRGPFFSRVHDAPA